MLGTVLFGCHLAIPPMTIGMLVALYKSPLLPTHFVKEAIWQLPGAVLVVAASFFHDWAVFCVGGALIVAALTAAAEASLIATLFIRTLRFDFNLINFETEFPTSLE